MSPGKLEANRRYENPGSLARKLTLVSGGSDAGEGQLGARVVIGDVTVETTD